MTEKSGVAGEVISLPKGGGALKGIGETFSPDLFTGTGNFTIPIALPSGRTGFQPELNLLYSSGNGNGPFGLGWNLSVPGVARKTSKGVPRYQDATDVFNLSGTEDLIPVSGDFPGTVQYRPRTEGLFARIVYHRDSNDSYWEVRSKDGLISTYGTPGSLGSDPAVIADPTDGAQSKLFAWRLTETRDSFGNRMIYEYERDSDEVGPRHWDQLYLSRIRYADYNEDSSNEERFLISVTFDYGREDGVRPDPFSDYRAGFEIRTRKRCRRIHIRTHADMDRLARTYELIYLDERVADGDLPPNVLPRNGVSLLSQIKVVGHDESQAAVEDRTQELPALEFSYTAFEPERRQFSPLEGKDLPTSSLASPNLELADLFGDGLPDILEMNGVVRYWRNLGGGRFDLPRLMRDAPAGVALADKGVQLIDADGDGRIDLLVSNGNFAGYFALQFGGLWDRHSFQRYDFAPSFDLEGSDVQLVDLDGDGVIDAIRSGSRFECYFNDPYEGWHQTRHVERRALEDFPNVDFNDPRVKWADMTGDGLQDIVMCYDGNIEYWPNLGHGNWGRRVLMRGSPKFPSDYDPRQILIGDVDGDGAADVIFVDHCKIILWINQSGNRFAEPITLPGTPAFTNEDDVRLVDLLGTGVGGILWSQSALGSRRERFHYLDFTDSVKPYLLNEMNNHRGARTTVTYHASTQEYLRDQARPEARWKTTIPFPVPVVSQLEVVDEFSRSRMVTEYQYHHGYWDGGEREYRGFGCVDYLSTETFKNYYAGESDDAEGFERVTKANFAPPTLTRTWFHLGPVGDEFGEWGAVDHRDQYWQEDRPFFAEERSELTMFISELPNRRDRRDALRALRGTKLRTELYALDDSPRMARPYTVTESVSGLREIEPAGVGDVRQRIFFPHLRAQRTTQWERGNDPLTQINYTDDHDEYGQPQRELQIGCPRGWRDFEDERFSATNYLGICVETGFSRRDDHLYMVDRIAIVSSFEVFPKRGQPAAAMTVSEIKARAFDGSAPRDIIGQSLSYYDGEAFVGLPLHQLGEHGALVRSETLVTTEDILMEAYREDEPSVSMSMPPYLCPDGAAIWPAEYPEAFRERMAPYAGYVFSPGDLTKARGYFSYTALYRYDFQAPGANDARGLLLAMRDPLNSETSIEFDSFALLPVTVTDSAGLSTVSQNDYRVVQPSAMTDPNGNRTVVTFTPLGLPESIAVMGKAGEAIGDTRSVPGTHFEYDLLAYDNSPSGDRQPVSTRTRRRLYHVNDLDAPHDKRDDTTELVEYTDGFDRLLQTRARGEEEIFGEGPSGAEILAPDQDDLAGAGGLVIGHSRAPGQPPNVIVTGWQIYDNKGQVIKEFEPFFDKGWEFVSLEQAQSWRSEGVRDMFGRSVRKFYDPRGQVIRKVNMDGSEERVIYGVPRELGVPNVFDPTPWEAYTYDANDLAAVSVWSNGNDNAISLSDRAPPYHHFTPSSIEIDSLNRVVRSIQRNGPDPADELVTESTYDIRGNLLTVSDPLRRIAFEYTYDLINQAVRMVSIDAGTTRAVFDALGNTMEQRDNKGSIAFAAYDTLNRQTDLWARDDANQNITLRQHFVYGDNAGEIGMDQAAAYERNALGLLVRHYDEAGCLTAERYDHKGSILKKGRRIINDAEILSVFNDAASNDWHITSYQVDWQPPGMTIAERENAILATDDYITSMRYDALDRVTKIRYPRDVENHRRVLKPTYSAGGMVEGISVDGVSYVERIVYNAKGERSLIAYGNGIMVKYAYHRQTARLARLYCSRFSHPQGDPITFQPVGAPLQDFSYEHDLVGNITAIHDRARDSGILNTQQGKDALDRTFTYDAIYRLTSATGRECGIRSSASPWEDFLRCTDLASTRPYRELYRYDGAGSLVWLRHEHSQANGHIVAFNRDYKLGKNDADVPATNRVSTVAVNNTELHCLYDNKGNLIQEGMARHFEWDYENRMKSFRNQTEGTEPTTHTHYFYDGNGQRVCRWVRLNGGRIELTVYVDGIFEHHRRVLGATVRENNTIHVVDEEQTIASVLIGSRFPDDTSPRRKFQLVDHLGSVSIVLDEVGGLVNQEEFTPYGETSFGSYLRKGCRFAGKERDSQSGLYDYGFRWYSPWLGRWISPDPIGPEDDKNLYVYAGNNPIALVDQEGLSSQSAGSTRSPPEVNKCYENIPDKDLSEVVANLKASGVDLGPFGIETVVDAMQQARKPKYEGPTARPYDPEKDLPMGPVGTALWNHEMTGLEFGEAYVELVTERRRAQEDGRRLKEILKHNREAILNAVENLVPGEGIIYLRTNLATGEQYIGQSIRLLKRQIEHDENLGTAHNYRVLWEGAIEEMIRVPQRGKPARIVNSLEIMEQDMINRHHSRRLVNARNQINARAWRAVVENDLISEARALGRMTPGFTIPLPPRFDPMVRPAFPRRRRVRRRAPRRIAR